MKYSVILRGYYLKLILKNKFNLDSRRPELREYRTDQGRLLYYVLTHINTTRTKIGDYYEGTYYLTPTKSCIKVEMGSLKATLNSLNTAPMTEYLEYLGFVYSSFNLDF